MELCLENQALTTNLSLHFKTTSSITISIMLRRLLFLLLFAPFLLGANPTAVDFYTGSLNVAKQRAAQEGKLYFVDFVANWCMPCRWMDETTFSDPRVAQYMNENYVPVKVDIDNFDGYAYKQQYNIRVLPSMLIFNSKGEIVARYQESLPPSRLLKILAEHNTSANRQITAPVPPKPVIKPAPTRPAPVARPDLMVKPTPSIQPDTRPSSYAAPVIATPPARPRPPRPQITRPASTTDGLYRFSVRRQASEGFSVQIGVYGDYENLIREASKVEEQFDDPIIVHIAKLNEKSVYKILVGEFATREEATKFKSFLIQKGLEGFIKDLSTM